jgi:ASC-1-like (ASCH) protein
LECRINYPSVRSIKVGDPVRYFWEDQIYDVKIIGVRRYKGFYEMLKNEDVDKLVPGMNFKQALNEYQRIYPEWKVKKYGGIVVFEAEPI